MQFLNVPITLDFLYDKKNLHKHESTLRQFEDAHQKSHLMHCPTYIAHREQYITTAYEFIAYLRSAIPTFSYSDGCIEWEDAKRYALPLHYGQLALLASQMLLQIQSGRRLDKTKKMLNKRQLTIPFGRNRYQSFFTIMHETKPLATTILGGKVQLIMPNASLEQVIKGTDITALRDLSEDGYINLKL